MARFNTVVPARTRGRILVVLGIAIITAACSLIVDKDKDQCASDGDCAPAGKNTCVQGVCVPIPGSNLGDASPDADASGGDATTNPDAGCIPKVPVTDLDFLNEPCTTAECVPFDNCVRLKVCDGGLPALVDPPVGGI